jgi:SNF2 family DNA or RNA helicase
VGGGVPRWAPYWTAVAWRGTPKRRRELAGTADVYVASYDTARMDAKSTNPGQSPLVALDPRALVADECHLIKNPHAARTAAVRRLARNVTAFVALSGTPITHHPATCGRRCVPRARARGRRGNGG